MQFSTLSAALSVQARAADNDCASGIVFVDRDLRERSISYGLLRQRALSVLHFLQRSGVRRGDELILCVDNHSSFVDALWACVLSGIIAVPLATGTSREHRRKILNVVRTLQRPVLFTDRKQFATIAGFAERAQLTPLLRGVRSLLIEDIPGDEPSGAAQAAAADDPVMIQFSSGSTGTPKGVVLTHGNLLSNIRSIRDSAGLTAADTTLSWMPLTHDMGLIGFHLLPLILGMRQRLMPPELFVRRPLLWLEQASAAAVTTLGSPNFGYRHLLEALKRTAPQQLDLSAVRLIFNGAEPIAPQLCDEFSAALAPYGLKRNTIFPVYGLAEGTLAVAFAEPAAPLKVKHFQRRSLSEGVAVQLSERNEPGTLSLVSVGRPLGSCAVRITDSRGGTVDAGCVGRLQIKGASVTAGYYGRPGLLRDGFTDGGWFDTGDLGVQLDDLYIVGRHKDTININGQNFHGHDLERLCEQLPGLDAGKIACVAVRDANDDSDCVAVFVQFRRPLADFLPLLRQIRHAISDATGFDALAVLPLASLPRTSSGKLQRFALQEAWVRGEFVANIATLEALLRQDTEPRPSPISSIERELRIICSMALPSREIGLNDNLIDCGADSLALASIQLAIDERYPNTLKIEDFLDYPTLSALAGFLETKVSTAVVSGSSAAVPSSSLRV